MRNINVFNEYLNRMMQTAEQASKTTKNLRTKPDPEHLDKLDDHLQEITDHLNTLQDYLNHPGDYTMEELANWFSTTATRKHAEYRHSPD